MCPCAQVVVPVWCCHAARSGVRLGRANCQRKTAVYFFPALWRARSSLHEACAIMTQLTSLVRAVASWSPARRGLGGQPGAPAARGRARRSLHAGGGLAQRHTPRERARVRHLTAGTPNKQTNTPWITPLERRGGCDRAAGAVAAPASTAARAILNVPASE